MTPNWTGDMIYPILIACAGSTIKRAFFVFEKCRLFRHGKSNVFNEFIIK